MKILVTGAAGFVGMHCATRILENGDEVIGVDNLNHYYDVSLKMARLDKLKKYPRFNFHKVDVSDRALIAELFLRHKPDRVLHLAAQAGVRHSLNDPHAYVDANLLGFINILEGCRIHKVDHLVYASSSSVYGVSGSEQFSECDNVDQPISLYAATKKSNELMAHSYSHLYGLPTTGLRLFTVYGPWGRPDMALFLFGDAMMKGEPINVFNNGKMVRDFTYIDDVVEGVVRVLEKPPRPKMSPGHSHNDPETSRAPYKVFNIGNGKPASLMDYIVALENALGVKAKKNFLPMQPGDVPKTSADMTSLKKWVGFKPGTTVSVGVQRFAEWYLNDYIKD